MIKKIIYPVIFISIGLFLYGCYGDDTEIEVEDFEIDEFQPAQLNDLSATSVEVKRTTELEEGNENANAVEMSWNEATGNIAQDLTYFIEMDIAENDFATSTLLPAGENGFSELSKSLSYGQLNDAVNQIAKNGASINYDESNNFEIRVITMVGDNYYKGYSESKSISIKPYYSGLTEELIISSEDKEDKSFSEDDGIYETRLVVDNNQSIKLYSSPKDSGIVYNYAYFEKNGYDMSSNIVENSENNSLQFNGEFGTYDFIIDKNNKMISLLQVYIPENIYMVGSYNGWNNGDESQIMYSSDHDIFSRIVKFDDNSEFKIVPTSGSWDGSYGADENEDGKFTSDNGQNIKVENAGTYLVQFNFNDFTYKLTEVPENLYLIGSINGWDNNAALPFTKVSEGKFEITQTLTDTDEFKFLPQLGSWDNDWGESKFYSGMLVRDDEQNVKSPGNDNYKIIVDFNKGEIIFE